MLNRRTFLKSSAAVIPNSRDQPSGPGFDAFRGESCWLYGWRAYNQSRPATSTPGFH